MGLLSISRTLVALLFVGSAALAQQGLVVDPWHRAVTSVAAPLPPLRAPLPASGLPPSSPAPRAAVRLPEPPPAQASKAGGKWSPPVVALLVDPWAKLDVTAASKPRWLSATPEIIDPWANDSPPAPPRVASRPAESRHSAIF